MRGNRLAEGLFPAHGECGQAFMAFSAVVGQREPPPGIWRRSCREPSVPMSVARMEPSPSSPVAAWSTAAPGSVPEQDAGGAVLPVHDGGKLFRGNDKRRFHLAGAQVLYGRLHGEQEAGAGGGNIKGCGILGPQGILDVAGGSGRERIRCDGGDDDQVDVFRAAIRRTPARAGRPSYPCGKCTRQGRRCGVPRCPCVR